MPIDDRVLEHFSKALQETGIVQRVQVDEKLREGVETYTIAMVWYFARAVGLTIDQVSVGLAAVAAGRARCVD